MYVVTLLLVFQFSNGILSQVRELVFTSVYEGYTIGSLATGRTTYAGQDLREILDHEGHRGPPGWGLGIGLPSLYCKNSFVLKPWHREVMTQKWTEAP